MQSFNGVLLVDLNQLRHGCLGLFVNIANYVSLFVMELNASEYITRKR